MNTNSSSGPKLISYSGHDTNIVALLSVLGAYKRHLPEFACSIYFELRKIDDEPYVNVYYKNDEADPVTIDGCEFNCKLDDFKEVLKKYIINVDMFLEECGA